MAEVVLSTICFCERRRVEGVEELGCVLFPARNWISNEHTSPTGTLAEVQQTSYRTALILVLIVRTDVFSFNAIVLEHVVPLRASSASYQTHTALDEQRVVELD